MAGKAIGEDGNDKKMEGTKKCALASTHKFSMPRKAEVGSEKKGSFFTVGDFMAIRT